MTLGDYLSNININQLQQNTNISPTLGSIGINPFVNQQTNQQINWESFLKSFNKNLEYNNKLQTGYGIVNGIATLGNLWLGFQNYKLSKDQLNLAKDQWNQTKEEIDRIKNVRSTLAKQYLS